MITFRETHNMRKMTVDPAKKAKLSRMRSKIIPIFLNQLPKNLSPDNGGAEADFDALAPSLRSLEEYS
jgi:hypothetical protein